MKTELRGGEGGKWGGGGGRREEGKDGMGRGHGIEVHCPSDTYLCAAANLTKGSCRSTPTTPVQCLCWDEGLLCYGRGCCGEGCAVVRGAVVRGVLW